MVLPDLHGEFFSEIVRGMDREASQHGYLLLLSNMHAGGEQARMALHAMRGRVDGLIVMAPHLGAAELAMALPTALPAVLINTRSNHERHPSIHLDNRAGARAVVDHLVAIGRTRIVHLAGPAQNIDALERRAAFRSAADAHGIPYEILEGDFEEASGQAAIAALLSKGARSMRSSRRTTIWRSARSRRSARPAFGCPKMSRSPASTTFRWRATSA